MKHTYKKALWTTITDHAQWIVYTQLKLPTLQKTKTGAHFK